MKTDFSRPDTGAWQAKADDIFLAQFRGLPCEVCGKTSAVYGGRITRSCGHHIAEKDQHRPLRYDSRTIVVLCPEHHGQYSARLSPHSTDTLAQGRFYAWLFTNKYEQWMLTIKLAELKWDKSWTYKEKYVELGGQINSKTGFVKDDKPINHASIIKSTEPQGEAK